MLDTLFRGIFDAAYTTVIPVEKFLLCVGVSLGIGGLITLTAGRRGRFSHSFRVTLALLPALVCVTIMMVNGNIGAGVATAGAFSLVRFRSAAGSAREIALIFLAMVTGLIAGMGYLAYAALLALLLCLLLFLLSHCDPDLKERRKLLRITIPEDLDYDHVFDGVLSESCASWRLQQVKTTNMGSLFKLKYEITLRDAAREKALIDQLRCLNGNLEISLAPAEAAASDL